MSAITEGLYPFEFLVGDRLTISVENIVIASGQNLGPGAVIAKTFVGSAVGANASGNTGNPTIGAITVGAKAEAGEYLVVFTSATNFQVFAPNGNFIGSGSTGAAFSSAQRLTFTLTAGGTAAVAGDVFVITVTEGVSTYAAASGGDASGILGTYANATGGAVAAVAIVRMAEYNVNEVSFGSMDAAHIASAKAALARRNIIGRSSI